MRLCLQHVGRDAERRAVRPPQLRHVEVYALIQCTSWDVTTLHWHRMYSQRRETWCISDLL